MRNEASIEQWRSLYDLAVKLKVLEPWKFFWNVDIITIQLPDEQEPSFISMTGRNTDEFAITVYPGDEAFNDFLLLSHHQQLELSPSYLFFNQRNLTCYFGNRDEVSPPHYKIIKELGYRFRGKNQWIYFQSFKPYFIPYLPEEGEVLYLTKVYEQLIPIVEAYIEGENRANFDEDETILRSFNHSNGEWESRVQPLSYSPKNYPVLYVKPEEEMFQWLNDLPQVDAELEVDMNYLFTNIEELEEIYGRPVNPKILVLIDHKDYYVLNHTMLTPQHDEPQEILDLLFSFFEEYGLPKVVYFRNPVFGYLLKELFPFVGVHLIQSKELPACDDFYQSLIEGNE